MFQSFHHLASPRSGTEPLQNDAEVADSDKRQDMSVQEIGELLLQTAENKCAHLLHTPEVSFSLSVFSSKFDEL